jgi:1,4-dihydroxy-6-naphthoate synthase
MTLSNTADRLTSQGNNDAGTREITIAHSPDSDDAFMFYGLATHKVRVPGLRFTHTLCDM